MCCFSRKVELVKGTSIFARESEKSRQFLVYEMTFKAAEDLAMVLPLPVPHQTAEKSVRFINLEKYPDFFKDLATGFPNASVKAASMGSGSFGGGTPSPKLEVVSVGAFEASFIPTVGDFSRLEDRFRLPDGTWEKLPRYKNYGFAVFKLKQDVRKTHPMAFEFPRANPDQLFFPTVHIHDGQIHDRAAFDHTLYAQFGEHRPNSIHVWTESTQPVGMVLKIDKCEDLVDEEAHAYMRVIRGVRKNADVVA